MLPMPQQPMADEFDFFADQSMPELFSEPMGFGGMGEIAEAPIVLSGDDLRRFEFRLDQSLARAKQRMETIHANARIDRAVYRTLEREEEYPGQPNLTTPLSANKADGLLAHIVDAIETRPLASFVPEGIGRPAERAAQVAPLNAAYLEREINRGGSRERIIRDMSKEAAQVGTGLAKMFMVQHPSGEWFVQLGEIIKLENFFVDRVAVSNLKHVFCGYEERIPYYQLEEMADSGLLDRDALESIRESHSAAFIRTEEEAEANFFESSHAFQEETAVHKIHYCYMRFRAAGEVKAQIYEAVWSEQWKKILAVRPNSVRAAFDHPPIAMHRIGKSPRYLFGRGIMRRLSPIQNMADNAINSHLALNNLAASPPFVYKQHSPFGRLMQSKRRIVPGVGIPSLGAPDQGDVKMLEFRNPGLSLQDIGVAQSFADRATYTEEAIGSSSDRKTLGQFRVEVQRGTMRVRLDLGDLAYDAAQTLTMMWAMMVKYKIVPAGIVEVEEGGKYLSAKDITEEELTEVMDSLVMPMFAQGQLTPQEMAELEEEFNARLTEDMIPSARRSDLTIHLTGTKVIADKAAELEMLGQLTPYILQGLELAKSDTYFNYHLRSIVEAMGFKDVEKRIPADPGKPIDDPAARTALGAPLAETITRSSNMV
jgi:hypothetical protein